ncbi:tRNA delta(2)-isopentenylpyrophosphate transferase [Oceanococcus atlanticus]|uniref:tRNA dimethylallyltransferase n=1 Tax=Oceanococcus atlanticus TaxID=1317117 RepID=A0A1Y1SI45_9GAMM|nr:tRNA (adenosine(37)-N6)-dimethylallyltransferase MiaA [Oceanococcus atlanticus]ORE88869.1 tRNA delta(2)-isopentenylpyrophosphate transferase [Oceanococcus atlanticus]RZO83248.1 MAG: tRNA (adenosine(37)-N6)-dimethylallyltransferase MiaA [Oceanococcus sp.]
MSARAVFILGPTASGKSSLALDLAAHWPVEIITMDSAQIYRGMDIGTAKPDMQQQAMCPHHLLDIRDPAERYSAAEFAADAARLIDEIAGRGALPVVVGGTFLYMRALLEGLHDMPAADHQLREDIESEAAKHGWPALHRELVERDPQAAALIHPNDAQRIQRALELARGSGANRSALWQAPRQPVWAGRALKLALVPATRDSLREEIAVRFKQMMAQGFLEEVRLLRARNDLDLSLPSMRSVGYRQLWQHLDGELALEDAVNRGIIATRQYAKRQITWLRRERRLVVLPHLPDLRAAAARRAVEAFLAQRAT